ncbi:ras-related protein Rab-39B-like [Latimeria chalumnae]|uniref:RAB42, member RAS oncogene family a n=1 Tax=Latimeria chalumnae TaxID=7897 RepID=H3AXX4_LATCH|nr:PREDICTED: ras-related protein Rab-39B-like [Latimeria chalumnae]|eukprot:XP_005993187.1 PREDICTED: ras-related protein Rab-39B-like [Latimeria chalumnae]
MEVLWQYQFRIILLGDSTVGKSSLLRRFSEGQFTDNCDPTVGVDFYAKTLEVEAGMKIKLQLWDTAGQERFRSITKSYYRNSVGGLLVFDLTNRKSFEHVKDWFQEVTEHMKPYKLILVLIGHKSDLTALRKVSQDEGETLASALGVQYIETSARNNQNVDRAFEMLTNTIYELLKSGGLQLRPDWDGVKVGQKATPLSPNEIAKQDVNCQC